MTENNNTLVTQHLSHSPLLSPLSLSVIFLNIVLALNERI